MFGGKKRAPPVPSGDKQKPRRNNLPLLMNVPGMEDDNLDDMLDDGDDADLEAELADLVSGGGRQVQKRQKPKTTGVVEDLDAMVASCMKDYGDDDDMSDTEDPDLLAELQGLDGGDVEEDKMSQPRTGTTREHVDVEVGHSLTETIQRRLALYKEAEQVSLGGGDKSRARRFNRGVKTLVDLERRALSGRPVAEDEIPPHITVSKRVPTDSSASSETVSPVSDPPPIPSRSAPPPAATHPPRSAPLPPPSNTHPTPTQITGEFQVSSPSAQLSQESRLQSLRGEYKTLALSSKAAGDKETAMTNMKLIKMCDTLLVEVRAGHTVDLSPVLPGNVQPSFVKPPETLTGTFSRDDPVPIPAQEENIPAPNPEEFGAPPPPATIAEALHQRLDKYQSEVAKAKEDGNGSKARRMGRIVKQYQEAIATHKAGRPLPRADLPDPPGFSPIPVTDHTPAPTAFKPAVTTAGIAAVAGADVGVTAVSKGPSPPRTTLGRQASQAGSHHSVQSKQLEGLEKRQKLFKEAALQAKQQGQTDTAREYLRQALSFNKLIEVSKGGLPVDMGTLPVPPQMQVKTNMDFEIVSVEDCGAVTGDREEMFSKLEQDLIGQVKMCMNNRTYFKEVGDVASANKFEQMALHSKKDLDAIRFAFKRGDPVPKFHYETRAFSRVVSNTDLTDNDLELTLVTGINYTVKSKEMPDTYIRWEFPFPRDAPATDKTGWAKGSNNPEYNATYKLVINPRDKSFQRIVKRGALKVEVWSKGGFLRSDILLGTATVKISPLETSCEIHDSYDLYDGRKPVGGKVEVKVRIRNGIIAKQIEQKQEKWLVVQF